jgi:hypothetical protein
VKENTHRFVTVTALAASLCLAAFCGEALAQTADAPASAPQPAAAPAPAKSASAGTKKKKSAEEQQETIDARIDHLHKQLQITPAQEDLWKNVAQVMRDNAEKMSSLIKARMDNAKSMTAIDDLKAYADITDAHAEGTKNMLTAFQALYNSMSDEQKKAADTEFREHHLHHH